MSISALLIMGALVYLAQQCTALDRRFMAPEEEALIKNANSMAAIREVIEENSGMRYLSFDPTDRPPGRAQREENLSRSSPTDRPSAARSAAIF